MQATLPRDHAAEAAKLLRRLAIFLAFVMTPVLAFSARTTATIALPLVAVLFSFAAMVDIEQASPAQRLRAGLRSALVLAVIYASLWFVITLAWTPAPGSAAGRLAAILGIVVVTAAAILALPEKMRASTLNLIPLGAFFAAVTLAALTLLTLFEVLPARWRLDRAMAERGIAALALFTVVGAGWLLSRSRVIDAVALLAVTAAALAAAAGWQGSIPFAIGLALFVVGRFLPAVAAILVCLLALAALLAAPLFPAMARSFGPDLFGWSPSEAEAARQTATWMVAEWNRFVGGFGFDALRFVGRAGGLPVQFPGIPLLDLWFEGGFPGAASAFVAIALASSWAMRARAGVGAAAFGALGIGIAYAALGSPTVPRGYGLALNWWLATVALTLVAIAAIARGQFRTRRPKLRQPA